MKTFCIKFFSEHIHHFIFPGTVNVGYNSSTILPILVIVFFKKIKANLVGVNWYLWGFECNSLMTDNIEYLVVCLLTICVSSLNKYLFKYFAHFKNGIFAFYYWVMFFIYYEYKSFIRYIISKRFPPFYELSFHAVNGVLWRTQIFYFYKVQLIFFFCPLWFWCHI